MYNILFPYTNPTPKLTHHTKLSAFLHFQKTVWFISYDLQAVFFMETKNGPTLGSCHLCGDILSSKCKVYQETVVSVFSKNKAHRNRLHKYKYKNTTFHNCWSLKIDELRHAKRVDDFRIWFINQLQNEKNYTHYCSKVRGQYKGILVEHSFKNFLKNRTDSKRMNGSVKTWHMVKKLRCQHLTFGCWTVVVRSSTEICEMMIKHHHFFSTTVLLDNAAAPTLKANLH